MHILYVLTRAANGRLYADLFRELASYFGYPDASLTIGGKTYFVHFIHHRMGTLDEQTHREAVEMVTKRLEAI
ncbi:MAG: hypothetical protein ABI700_02700 [Chloroflexota bacterium]